MAATDNAHDEMENKDHDDSIVERARNNPSVLKKCASRIVAVSGLAFMLGVAGINYGDWVNIPFLTTLGSWVMYISVIPLVGSGLCVFYLRDEK